MNFDTAVFAGLLAGPFIYILVTLIRPAPASFDEFHLAGRGIKPSAFIDSTIMYGLQVAVISLFATWGYYNGLWAALVALFWGIGYVIIAIMLRAGLIDPILLERRVQTLHEYLSQRGQFPALAVVASLVSLLAISGPAMFEAHFVANEVSRAVFDGDANLYLLLFVCFIFASALYMAQSGFRGVVRTDQWQLAIGYLGFVAFFALLLVQLSTTNLTAAIIVLSVAVILTTLIFIRKYIADRAFRELDVLSLAGTGVAPLVFLLTFVFLDYSAPSEGLTFGSFWIENTATPFTVLSIISLFIANGLYQIVDVGHWQRLLSINIDVADVPGTRKKLAQATAAVALYSPATWLLAIFFGIALRYLFPESDPYTIIGTLFDWLKSGDASLSLAAFFFVVSLTAIMFSTLDSLVAAVSFTAHNDIILKISPKATSVWWARIVLVIIITAMAVYYQFLRGATGEQFDAILYMSWSFQIAMVPVVLATFIRPVHGIAGVASILAGAAAASYPIIIGEVFAVYEVSPLYALVSSTICLVVLGAALPKPASAHQLVDEQDGGN